MMIFFLCFGVAAVAYAGFYFEGGLSRGCHRSMEGRLHPNTSCIILFKLPILNYYILII